MERTRPIVGAVVAGRLSKPQHLDNVRPSVDSLIFGWLIRGQFFANFLLASSELNNCGRFAAFDYPIVGLSI